VRGRARTIVQQQRLLRACRPQLKRDPLVGGPPGATVFTSQGQAKRFFVDKIIAQAEREGHPLTENERWMLSFSESDPEFVFDPSRNAAFAAEISDADYEKKVAGLAVRAHAADVESNPDVEPTYREAYRVLAQGDHYILIMLDAGLSRRLRPWWAFWR
jgi:hypothetical protein